MEHNTQHKKREKRTYERPVLRTIDLAAEEVMVVGCKQARSGNGFGGVTCVQNHCIGAGS